MEQIRVSENCTKLVSVDKEGNLLYETPGKWKCRRCGGTFESSDSSPFLCGCCERKGVFDSVSPAVFEELWRPYGEPVVFGSLDGLYGRISEFVSDHLFLRDVSEVEVLTRWIIASYKTQCFGTVPYLQFLGSIESGKSRALEVLGMLSYRAVNLIAISPAALCRVIEQFKPTVLLDQAEQKFNLKSERGCEMYDIFMSGYKKGQRYVVSDMDDAHGTISRDVFGFKAVASTRVFDEAFASRSILLRMKQGIPRVKDVGDDSLERAGVLRNMLLYYHLKQDKLILVDPPLTGRRREMYLPLLRICNDFGVDWSSLDTYISEDVKSTEEEMSDTLEASILGVIKDELRRIDAPEEVHLSDLAARLEIESRIVGHRLKNMNIKRKRDNCGMYIDLSDEKTRNELSYLFSRYHLDG